MSETENRKARAQFQYHLLRKWDARGKHRSAIHFALLMLSNEDAASGEIRVTEAGLGYQYQCSNCNVLKWLRVVKQMKMFEVCGSWWSPDQLERKRQGVPASPSKVYRRLPVEGIIDIDNRYQGSISRYSNTGNSNEAKNAKGKSALAPKSQNKIDGSKAVPGSTPVPDQLQDTPPAFAAPTTEAPAEVVTPGMESSTIIDIDNRNQDDPAHNFVSDPIANDPKSELHCEFCDLDTAGVEDCIGCRGCLSAVNVRYCSPCGEILEGCDHLRGELMP